MLVKSFKGTCLYIVLYNMSAMNHFILTSKRQDVANFINACTFCFNQCKIYNACALYNAVKIVKLVRFNNLEEYNTN